jgi:hypothetical protein
VIAAPDWPNLPAHAEPSMGERMAASGRVVLSEQLSIATFGCQNGRITSAIPEQKQ